MGLSLTKWMASLAVLSAFYTGRFWEAKTTLLVGVPKTGLVVSSQERQQGNAALAESLAEDDEPHTADPEPSWCDALLSGRRPPAIPTAVAGVLTRHCRVDPRLPLERMLPRMDVFRAVHEAVAEYQTKHNATLALLAGRGTTGTRSLAEWIAEFPGGIGVLHFTEGHCPQEATGQCLSRQAGNLLNATHAKAFKKGVRGNPSVTDADYDRWYRALVEALRGVLLQCGGCGDSTLVLGDTPWVNLFGELYLASGPGTKVVLSRRQAWDWATSRVRHHGKSKLGYLCGNQSSNILDPFSYTQCHGVAKDLNQATPDELVQAMKQYNHYIHSIVPEDYLLDLNLFSSSLMDRNGKSKEAIRKWSNHYKMVVRDFLLAS